MSEERICKLEDAIAYLTAKVWDLEATIREREREEQIEELIAAPGTFPPKREFFSYEREDL